MPLRGPGLISHGLYVWPPLPPLRVPGEAGQDLEGMQTMRNLARNMAWMLKCIEAGRKAGIDHPEVEQSARTNFIR